MSNMQLLDLMSSVENLSELNNSNFEIILGQNQITISEYEEYKHSKHEVNKYSNIITDNIIDIFKSNDRNYFTIQSNDNFTQLVLQRNDNTQSWNYTLIYHPLNDHTRALLKIGDVLFCNRIGQFPSLEEALQTRGIYGVGFAASEPLEIYPNETGHKKFGVIVAFPILLNQHLMQGYIQMHINTNNLTPYNGNRNDSLQHIPNGIHYNTILSMIARINPDLKTNFESLLGTKIKHTKLPDEAYGKIKSLNSRDISLKKLDLHFYKDSMEKAGLIFDRKLLIRFVSSLCTKPFVLLTGLSGSGKTKLAISFAKWICHKNINNFQILKEALRSESIKSNYKICHVSEKTVELINTRGSSGGIIPLPTKAIYETYEGLISGKINEDDDPKEVIREKIGVDSVYQKHIFGHYPEFHKIAVAMSKVNKEVDSETLKQYEVISVGADWTNREHLLGYINALTNTEYIKPENGALDLLIRAVENPELPFFLILDEMNLSHVERYFSDFLSTMESGENFSLHTGGIDNVPPNIPLPKNLFMIGTVNIDETTYMFSPKVLDRANVLEFRVTKESMEEYFINSNELDMESLQGVGASMAESFLATAKEEGLRDETVKDDLMPFFNELEKAGAEFGFRTASEMCRFVKICTELAAGEMTRDEVIDAAVMQKLLPKLHGSRKKLEPILNELIKLCKDEMDDTKYELTIEKLERMLKRVTENGFTSYAEA